MSSVEIMEREVAASGLLDHVGGGEVDMQIATAKRYPRSITSFKKTALAMATLDEETAEACFYALPRDGKTVEGPSARLAEICASAWGNMRIEARQVGEDDRFVTARGTAWDLEANVAIAYEVKRRITTSAKKDKPAKKYTDDMVGVTSNAASSIALRNAVFKVIPAAFWKPIYFACRQAAVGDVQTLANRRASMLAHFQKMGVTEAQVLGVLGVPGVEDITLDHMATLKGLATALRDGETTVEEAFAPKDIAPAIQQPQRKSETAAPSPAEPEPVATSKPAGVTLVKAQRRESKTQPGTFFWLVQDSAGAIFFVKTDELGQACQRFMEAGTPVEITSEAVAGQQYPDLTEIAAVTA